MIAVIHLLVCVGAVLGLPKNLETDTRIINGEQALPFEFPWQVSLQAPSRFGGFYHFCGGSILTPNFIMTAAHCRLCPPAVTVYAGTIDKNNYGTRRNIISFLAHPQFNSSEISMDYGIIEMPKLLFFSRKIQPIAIPGWAYDATSQFVGPAFTSGWGINYYDGPNSPNTTRPDMLLKANVEVLPDETCSGIFGSFYQSNNMICAENPDRNACGGDSGGPLVQKINGRPTLIGVTSWGSTTCNTMFPSGFAKVSTVRRWIIENTNLRWI